MVLESEIERWEQHKKRTVDLLSKGIDNRHVYAYDKKLLSSLRELYIGSLPISLLVLYRGFANGHCFEMSRLITCAFPNADFRLVSAEINNLKFNPIFIERYRNGELDDRYPIHCFVERIMDDGSVHVYDTASGLIYDKDLYYEIEEPKIVNIEEKETTKEILSHYPFCDVKTYCYALTSILPELEKNLIATRECYLEYLENEIEILKKKVDYERLVKEVEDAINNCDGLKRRK